jgi:hypothetical protein
MFCGSRVPRLALGISASTALRGIGPALAGNVGTGSAFALSRDGDQSVDVPMLAPARSRSAWRVWGRSAGSVLWQISQDHAIGVKYVQIPPPHSSTRSCLAAVVWMRHFFPSTHRLLPRISKQTHRNLIQIAHPLPAYFSRVPTTVQNIPFGVIARPRPLQFGLSSMPKKRFNALNSLFSG